MEQPQELVKNSKRGAVAVDLPGGELGDVIRELQQLRWASDAAEWTLLKRCQEVESSDIWKEHFRTFDTLLTRFNVCSSTRYREFVAAEAQLGETRELAKKAGMSSVLQAAKIKQPERRAMFLEASTQRAKATGVPWSNQEAKAMRNKIAGTEPQPSAWNTRVDELSRLRTENAQLQRQARELASQVEAKDKEIAKLRERLVKIEAKGGAKAAKSGRK
jgi:methionyl-tRNA formyltransferase